jgi:hypothetical protein
LLTNSENVCAIVTHGSIPIIVEICWLGTLGAHATTIGSLKNLVTVQEVITTIVEDKTIVIIINLVSLGKPMAQNNVVITLQNLVVSDDMVRWEIMKEGGIQPLLKFMNNAIHPRQQEGGMGTLHN